jgi:tetratricopeptide (TPR) repeat protein
MRSRIPFFLLALLTLAVPANSAFAQKDKKKKTGENQPSQAARIRQAEFYFADGEKYFILEDYSKALLYFQRVIELDPSSSAAHYKIAEVLSKGNKEEDLQKAATSIDEALRLDKKNKYYYLLAANIYGSLTQFAKAEETIETMMREVKGTEEYLYELAAFYLYDNKPDKAVEVYNRAEAVLGVSEISSLQKQKIFFEQGKINEAIAEGEKLIEANPDEERYVLGLAETLSQNRQGARAIKYIEDYLQNHPDAGSAKLLLAALYRENGQEVKSRELLLSLFDDPSIDANSKVLVLGTYNVVLNKMSTKGGADPSMEPYVLELLNKLKRVHPENPYVYAAGGELYTTLKQSELARADYQKAIEKGSTTFEVWQNLLALEAQANAFDDLIEHTESGLELFPNQALLYYFNGYAHLRKRHYREAAQSLEQAKRLSSANQEFVAEVNQLLGDTYNGSREYQKSDAAYEAALLQNPDNALVLNNYSYYLALRNENLERAEKLAAQLIKANPENASYLDTYAWVLFMREKYKEARKVMERAIATGDAGAVHFEHYGDILFKLGDTDDAVRQWQRAKSMDNGNELIDKKIANRRLY